MPRPNQLKFDYITANFAYVRLLGDRKEIEKQTKVWDKVVVDRTAELQTWVGVCRQTVRRGIPTFVYVNNHYAGQLTVDCHGGFPHRRQPAILSLLTDAVILSGRSSPDAVEQHGFCGKHPSSYTALDMQQSADKNLSLRLGKTSRPTLAL